MIIGNENTTGTIVGAANKKVEPDPITLPKDQEETLTDLFGEGLSTTITGNFTDAEWALIYPKIETALNAAFLAGPTAPPPAVLAYQNRFRTVFGIAGWSIEVVKTSESDEWSKWKVTEYEVPTKTFLPGFGELDKDLQQSIIDAVTAIATGTPGMAKATPARDSAVRVVIAGLIEKDSAAFRTTEEGDFEA